MHVSNTSTAKGPAPAFPAAGEPRAAMAFYRNARGRDMKAWLANVGDLPLNVADARRIAEQAATQQLGRDLYVAESRLLDESIRDMLTALGILRALQAHG